LDVSTLRKASRFRKPAPNSEDEEEETVAGAVVVKLVTVVTCNEDAEAST
jgi:hypothetical protein